MGSHTTTETRAIMDSFRKIVKGLRNSSSQLSRRRSDLTSAQIFVLRQIGTHPELSINQLADLTFTHQSTVSEMVGKLVDQGFVEKNRSSKDRRKQTLALTASGSAAIKGAPKMAQEQLAEAITALPAIRRKMLDTLLRELVDQAGFSDQKPSMFFEENNES